MTTKKDNMTIIDTLAEWAGVERPFHMITQMENHSLVLVLAPSYKEAIDAMSRCLVEAIRGGLGESLSTQDDSAAIGTLHNVSGDT